MAPISVPGAPSTGGKGVNVPGAPSIGKGVNVPGAPSIGGLTIGQTIVDLDGVSRTFIWGDDFLESTPQVKSPANPHAKYFATHCYLPGGRGPSGTSGLFYDQDPYWTGYFDANRGVAIGSNNLRQSNSILTLQMRQATTTELALGLPGTGTTRQQLGAMIHTAGAIVYYPGVQGVHVDAYYSKNAGGPAGWHPTTPWQTSSEPVVTQTGGGISDEWDFAEANSTNTLFNRNHWVNGVDTPAGPFGAGNDTDGNFHLRTAILIGAASDASGNVAVYLDNVLKGNSNIIANTASKNANLLVTSHSLLNYDGEAYSAAQWLASGTSDSSGSAISLDYLRVLIPAGSPFYQPQTTVADVSVAYLGATTIVLPSQTALWGVSGLTEYVQGIPNDVNEPGQGEFSQFLQFPPGITYNSGTRTISVDFSTDPTGNPGTVFMNVMARAGSTDVDCACVPLSFCIFRGPPTTNVVNLSYPTSFAFSQDAYVPIPVGNILPKVTTASSLPSGLSISLANTGPTAGIISGTTPSAAGSYPYTVTTTNAEGQSSSTTYTLSTILNPFLYQSFAGTPGTAITGLTPGIGSGTWQAQFGASPATPSAIDDAGVAIYSPTTSGIYYNSTTPTSGDYSVEAVFLNLSALAADSVAIFGRASETADTYYFVRWTAGAWSLNKRVAGTNTALGSSFSDTFTSVATRTVRLTMTGTTISFSVNGTTHASVTDTAIAAAGFAGVRQAGAVQNGHLGCHITSLMAG